MCIRLISKTFSLVVAILCHRNLIRIRDVRNVHPRIQDPSYSEIREQFNLVPSLPLVIGYRKTYVQKV